MKKNINWSCPKRQTNWHSINLGSGSMKKWAVCDHISNWIRLGPNVRPDFGDDLKMELVPIYKTALTNLSWSISGNYDSFFRLFIFSMKNNQNWNTSTRIRRLHRNGQRLLTEIIKNFRLYSLWNKN